MGRPLKWNPFKELVLKIGRETTLNWNSLCVFYPQDSSLLYLPAFHFLVLQSNHMVGSHGVMRLVRQALDRERSGRSERERGGKEGRRLDYPERGQRGDSGQPFLCAVGYANSLPRGRVSSSLEVCVCFMTWHFPRASAHHRKVYARQEGNSEARCSFPDYCTCLCGAVNARQLRSSWGMTTCRSAVWRVAKGIGLREHNRKVNSRLSPTASCHQHCSPLAP